MAKWHDVVDPIAKRYELAAMFHANAVYNATGSRAVAHILREMAGIIDGEIARIRALESAERGSRLMTFRFFGLKFTIARDG